MSKRVIGLIGLGMAVQPHARSLIDLDDRIEVRWAYSRSASRCQQFARHFPWPTTTRLDDILGDDQIDAVIILTPRPPIWSWPPTVSTQVNMCCWKNPSRPIRYRLKKW